VFRIAAEIVATTPDASAHRTHRQPETTKNGELDPDGLDDHNQRKPRQNLNFSILTRGFGYRLRSAARRVGEEDRWQHQKADQSGTTAVAIAPHVDAGLQNKIKRAASAT
jgi:hypothetical protein